MEFVIDTGSSAKLIYIEMWETLKKKRLRYYFEKCEKKRYAYSSTESLKLLGKFRAHNLIEERGNGMGKNLCVKWKRTSIVRQTYRYESRSSLTWCQQYTIICHCS